MTLLKRIQRTWGTSVYFGREFEEEMMDKDNTMSRTYWVNHNIYFIISTSEVSPNTDLEVQKILTHGYLLLDPRHHVLDFFSTASETWSQKRRG